MQEFNGSERRKFVRIPSPLKSQFRLLEKSAFSPVSEWKHCIADNIGVGGARMRINGITDTDIGLIKNTNTIFEIKIYFPDISDKEFITKGSVNFVKRVGRAVWDLLSENHYEVGIKFLDLEKDSEELIKNFVMKNYFNSYGKTRPF